MIDDPVVAPATSGRLSLPWRLQANGSAQQRVAAIDVRDNLAELLVDDAWHDGLAYQAHFGYAGYDLYDVLSIAKDGSNLAVSYLYCEGRSLAWVWTLSYSQPLSPSLAVPGGACQSAPSSEPFEVRLPALMALPPPRRSGFTITGPQISLMDTGGAIVIGGSTYNADVLTVVDCSSCPGGSWYEVHCLFRRAGEAGFGILYLHRGARGFVQLEYTLMLPTLSRAAQLYDATWVGAPLAAVRGWYPLPGEPGRILARPPVLPGGLSSR